MGKDNGIGKKTGDRGFAEVIAALIILAITVAASPALIQITKHVSSEIAKANQPSSAYVSVSNGVVSATNPMPVPISLDRIRLTVNGEPVPIQDANHNGVWEPFEKITFDLNSMLKKDVAVVTLYIDGKEVYRSVYTRPTAFPEDAQFPVIDVNASAGGKKGLTLDISIDDDVAVALQEVRIGDVKGEKLYSQTDFLEEYVKGHRGGKCKHEHEGKKFRKAVEKYWKEIGENGEKGEKYWKEAEVSEKFWKEVKKYWDEIEKEHIGEHYKVEKKIAVLLEKLMGAVKEGGKSSIPCDLKHVSSEVTINQNLSADQYIRIVAKDITGKTSSKILWLRELAPEVHIIRPADGQKFWNNEDISILARAIGADRVYLYVDGRLILSENAGSSPYDFGKNVRLDVGTHTIKARAVNNVGAGEDSITITVIPDNPPTVRITQPKNGQTFTTTGNAYKLTVTATASDDRGVREVRFYDNGRFIGSDLSAPYQITATLGLGTHTIKAVAVDTAGQTASDTVMITVKKVGQPPKIVQASVPAIGWSTDFSGGTPVVGGGS
ncbi:hypothetical protein Ferp_0485 [Ferroglobus placidus DSM 10642]|uniref:Uncharacterized protein n=1 Tax=Ferroglobus placidus (strain DSM 10642 / AEDII12DO) TaxID=589924 RepID=D3S326_FERPA|nr:Ig-like domain-containing protein [Ferroglobus placidus]ADC64659.1 hypothetical protein Ferp_0485 [Ferroglobus placidus DSM 10642]